MSAPDVEHRPIAFAALALAAVVAASIGFAALLMHAWQEPLGGTASGAPSLLRTLHDPGPGLQSAPQIDAAAYRAEKSRQAAASGSLR